MRFITLTWFVLLLAVSAVANPVVPDGIIIDMGNGTNCVWPEVGETISATIYISPGTVLRQVGMDSVRIRVNRTFGGQILGLTSETGGWHSGDPESASGWYLDMPYCPPIGPWGFLAVGTVEYMYQGPPGLLIPLVYSPYTDSSWTSCEGSHPGFQSVLVGGVGESPPAGCRTPVDSVSWGVIKALYRPQ